MVTTGHYCCLPVCLLAVSWNGTVHRRFDQEIWVCGLDLVRVLEGRVRQLPSLCSFSGDASVLLSVFSE